MSFNPADFDPDDFYCGTRYFEKIKSRFKLSPVEWHVRHESGIDTETGKITYTWETAEAYILDQNVSAEGLPLEVGVEVSDVRKVRTDAEVQVFERLKIDGLLFEVYTVEEEWAGDTFLCYSLMCKKLKLEDSA